MRHRNFRLYFFGQLISLCGTWMQVTAQQWLVYRLTNSELSLGVVTFAAYLPVLLLSLPMGVIVDRLPRRGLILLTQSWFMVLALALWILTALGIVQYWHLLLLSVLLGIANALDMPARQAFFVDMVERDDLMNAIALSSSVFNGARIVGPALGGLVVAALGEAPAFLINAVTFAAVLAGLLLMRFPPAQRPEGGGSGMEDLRAGVRYLFLDRRALGLVSMVALLSLFAYPYSILFPAIARDVLHTGAEGFGALMAAMGVGALGGALGLAVLGDRRHKGRLLHANRLLFAGSEAAFALSHTTTLAMAALLFAGYAYITQLAVTNTLLQLLVPDELRGRVMSAYTWALGGFWPLGSLLVGALGDRLGAPTATLLSGAAALILTFLGWLWFPEVRELR
jgi:MFS family permease